MPAAKPLTDEEAILLLETEPDFAGAYACTPTEPFASDAEYLIASELRFTLQSLYVQARAVQAESGAPAAAADPGAADPVGGLLLRTLQGVFGMQALRP